MNPYFEALDEMIDRYDFYKVFFQNPYAANDYPTNDDFELYFGASRGCLILPNMPTVVKFDVENDALGSICNRELANYRRACNQKIEKYFAPARYIGTFTKRIKYWNWELVRAVVGYHDDDDDEFWFETINNSLDENEKEEILISIPLYEYTKAEETYFNSSVESKMRASNSKVFYKYSNVGGQFIDTYGIEEFKALEKFLSDNNINDLHEGNVGFIDGKIVFIDYGGYYCEDEED